MADREVNILTGLHIWVNRPCGEEATIAAKLTSLGAKVSAVISTAIEPVSDCSQLDEVLSQVQKFDCVVFTSIQGVRAVESRLITLGKSPQDFHPQRTLAVGPSTAEACRKAFAIPCEIPPEAAGVHVADLVSSRQGYRILLLRGNLAPEDLPNALIEKGAIVTNCVCYNNVDIPRVTLPEDVPDVIAFTSSHSAELLLHQLKIQGRWGWLDDCKIVCIGPKTAQTVRQYGLQPASIAIPHTLGGIVNAITELKERQDAR